MIISLLIIILWNHIHGFVLYNVVSCTELLIIKILCFEHIDGLRHNVKDTWCEIPFLGTGGVSWVVAFGNLWSSCFPCTLDSGVNWIVLVFHLICPAYIKHPVFFLLYFLFLLLYNVQWSSILFLLFKKQEQYQYIHSNRKLKFVKESKQTLVTVLDWQKWNKCQRAITSI